jgi:hypothetical protein
MGISLLNLCVAVDNLLSMQFSKDSHQFKKLAPLAGSGNIDQLRHKEKIKLWVKTEGAQKYFIHCKKVLTIFPSPAGMSLTKLSLGGNIRAQGEFSQ